MFGAVTQDLQQIAQLADDQFFSNYLPEAAAIRGILNQGSEYLRLLGNTVELRIEEEIQNQITGRMVAQASIFVTGITPVFTHGATRVITLVRKTSGQTIDYILRGVRVGKKYLTRVEQAETVVSSATIAYFGSRINGSAKRYIMGLPGAKGRTRQAT